MAEKNLNLPSREFSKIFGHQVGARGPMLYERKNILRRVVAYVGPLEIEGVDWAERGAGDSPERLQEMSNTLYALKVIWRKRRSATKIRRQLPIMIAT